MEDEIYYDECDAYERWDDYNVFEENCLREDEAMGEYEPPYDADADWRVEPAGPDYWRDEDGEWHLG